MLDFNNLNRQELASNGLYFDTQEEADMFAAVIRDELERRVGEAVYERAGKAAAEEFDNCITDEEAAAWFDRYCPDREVIVMKVQEELFREIMKYRRVI